MARKAQAAAPNRPHRLEVVLVIGENKSDGYARVDQEVRRLTAGRHHEGRERPRH